MALVCVPVVYLLSNASLEMFVTRYTMPTIPFMVVLSIIPLRPLLSGCTVIAHTPSAEANATPYMVKDGLPFDGRGDRRHGSGDGV